MQRVMITEFPAPAPAGPRSRAADYVIAGFQPDFPVAVESAGRLVGIVTAENPAEFRMIRSALRGATPQPLRAPVARHLDFSPIVPHRRFSRGGG